MTDDERFDPITDQLATIRVAPPTDLYRTTVVGAGAADRFTRIDSPIGPVWISWSIRGVTAVAPSSVAGDEQGFVANHRREAFPDGTLPSELADVVLHGLESGDTSDVPVDLSGVADFQRSVLTACATIPVGTVRPYGWIAEEIGNPGAVRAVGTALGTNPIPLIVPCHRVVKSDGTLGNYAFGPEIKHDLLVREGALLA